MGRGLCRAKESLLVQLGPNWRLDWGIKAACVLGTCVV